MRKPIALFVVVAGIFVAALVSAQPGLGIKKTAPLAGTGSSGSPLLITPCSAGSAYVSDGSSWSCATAGDVTAVSATTGGGLEGGATSGAASLGLLTSCASGEGLAWNGTAWACSSYTAGDGLTLTADDFDLNYTSDFTITADQLDLSTAVTAPGTLSVAGSAGAVSLAVTGASGQSTITALQNATGQTTNDLSAVRSEQGGTYDTTGGNITVHGVYGRATGTEAAGTNQLSNVGTRGFASGADVNYGLHGQTTGAGTTNYGVYGYAAGATTNYSFHGAAGTLYNAGSVGIGDTTPDYTLDVAGTLGVDGLITASGGLTSTAGTTKVGRVDYVVVETSMTANQNAWSPAGLSTASLIAVTSATGNYVVNGIDSTGVTAGRVLCVSNQTANKITFNHQNAGAVAADRLSLLATLAYDVGTQSGWICFAYSATNQWVQTDANRYFSVIYNNGALSNVGAATFSSTVTVASTLTANNDVVLGDAVTDTVSVAGDLTVADVAAFNGTADFSNTVTIAEGVLLYQKGDTDIGSSSADTLTVNAKIDSNVHYTGTAPTVSTCGTSPSVDTGSNDRRGRINVGAGATACTLTFAAEWASVPVCTLQFEYTSANTYLKIDSISTTAIVIEPADTTAFDKGAGTKIHYHCDGI